MADTPAEQFAKLTPAQQTAALQSTDSFYQFWQSKGNTAPPRPDQITAPADQPVIVYFDKDGALQSAPNPAYSESAPKTTVYGSADAGYFRLDNQGNSIAVQQPNADALIDKAVDRQGKEALRNERQANADAGKGYMTAQERAVVENNAARTGLDAATLNQRIAEFSATQQASDNRDKVAAATAQQNILQSQAQVGQIGATTEKTKVETGLLAATSEAQVEEAKARAAQAKEAAEASRQKRLQPQVLTQGVEGPSIYTQGPEGLPQATMRAGYVPKTMGEIAARTGQINAAIQAKGQELQAKVGPNYTPEQADADYQKWLDQVVTPEQGTLTAATQEAQLAQAKDQAAALTSAYTSAGAAGTRALQAWKDAAPTRIGPEGMSVFGANRDLSKMDPNKIFAPSTDPNQIQQDAVSAALKQIYPQGLPTAGGQNAAAMTPAQALDVTTWRPSAGGGAPPPAAAAAPGGAPPLEAGGLTPEQIYNRRMASYQTEAATNQGGGGVNGATPFQGIDPGGMAALMARPQAPPTPPPAPAPAVAPARRPAIAPVAAATAAAPYDWGSQATQAMNVGGWTDPTPWGTQASNSMNIGGWQTPEPTPDYSPSAIPANTPAYAPPPPSPPPVGLNVQGLNVPGLNIQGLNLGGLFNGQPWPGSPPPADNPYVPQPPAPPPPPPVAQYPPPAPPGIQGLNLGGLYNGLPWPNYFNRPPGT